MAVVFADVGQEVHIAGGLLSGGGEPGEWLPAMWRVVCAAPWWGIRPPGQHRRQYPAVLHTWLVPGDRLTLTVAPKGFLAVKI